MIRKVVKIDEDKCNGCGLCVPSCAEGAIRIIDGKAKLLADNLCDGLGACLGDCPQDAITIEERDADAFDEAAVDEHLMAAGKPAPLHGHPPAGPAHPGGGCPSAQVRSFAPAAGGGCPSARPVSIDRPVREEPPAGAPAPSRLAQWPVQLHLVPPTAPFLQEADVLLAADCAPFAYANFHEDLLKGKALLIACPKLDNTAPYLDKLTAMIQQSHIKSLTVVHMEVPCCTGLIHLARQAIAASGREIPLVTVCIGIRGERKG
ncbi:MAG: 4Fe-4S binding protein [Desulfuromonadales bacterium]|nr:4Fe-4S binding protein [Desulfuromonadales bacterium]